MKKRENKVYSRFAYGFADIYGGGAFVIISTFFTVFLTKALGMSPALAGTIPLIGKVWDAVTDPIMGNIADRTRSKMGPKRFYILVGSIISAITFALMWIPLHAASMVALYVFYAAMYMLFSTGFTIVMVPYNGLLPDMVEDYTMRAKFSSVRTVCSTFGAILAGLIPTLVIKDNTNANQYFTVAILFAVIFAISILITVFGTWEKEKEPIVIPVRESFSQSFSVYKSRSFRYFIAIFLCGQGSADFVQGLAIYFVDDVLNSYGGGNFTILMGVLLVSQFLGTIIFSVVMPKTSKKFPILLSFPIRIVATVCLYFVAVEGAAGIKAIGPFTLFHIMLFISFIVGIGMAASSTSIYAILSDMSDVDELITSVSRPGTVSGMATFIRKIATGLSSTVIGILLSIIGYSEVSAKAGLRQAISVQKGITHLYIWLPIILMLLTLLFAFKFPLGKAEFEVIKKEIARRKGEDSSQATDEEIAICEHITGIKYNDLWNKNHAKSLKR